MTAIHPFDLQARAELATHALTALLDQGRDGLLYFLANWRTRPPRADHGLWDCGDGSGRHVDALTLARSMVRTSSPAAERGQGDEQLEAWMLRLLGEEGLSWLPAEPWAAPYDKEVLLAAQLPGERYAEISWAQRGTLMGLLSRFLSTSDELYLTQARRMVDGLLRIAVRHPDGLFFPEGYYSTGGWHTYQARLFPGVEEINAAVLVPCLRLYEVGGYQPALDLAEGLARFALKHTQAYSPDGRLHAPHGGALQGHFHTHSCFIMGILKLGLVLGRREYIAWARQSYEYAQRWGTDFGWFPEHLGQRHGEICCTTDMIEIALLLGRHVDQAYYADAERFGRNQLLESQFLTLERLEHALDLLPADAAPPPWEGRYSTSDDIAGRQVGGFASRPALNDAFHLDGAALMQCCNAAGTRGLYDLWHYAVEEVPATGADPMRQAVHLRFSVETPHLRVVSYEPADGHLDITARQACEVAVRLPAGTPQAWAIAATEAAPQVRSLPVHNGYVRFQAGAGARVALYYPLDERAANYSVGTSARTAHCTGYWRGETLMRVEPAGVFYPLYSRPADLGPVEPESPSRPPLASL